MQAREQRQSQELYSRQSQQQLKRYLAQRQVLPQRQHLPQR
jgi:hypothetical protein